MKKIIFISLFLCSVFISSSFAANLSLEQLLDKIQANQNKILDMYAETTTTITSNMVMPGSTKKGPQKMVQKGKMWTKGDKSKIEMLSPTKQITINNGEKMAIINPQTGQKIVRERGQGFEGSRDQGMDLDKAMEYFDLSVKKLDASEPGSPALPAGRLETYVITGIPKKANKFLGKMEFYVDSTKWVPIKILMYSSNGKLMSRSEIEYQKISGLWVPKANKSAVNTPAGKMDVEMGFENVKVNKGMGDEVFEID